MNNTTLTTEQLKTVKNAIEAARALVGAEGAKASIEADLGIWIRRDASDWGYCRHYPAQFECYNSALPKDAILYDAWELAEPDALQVVTNSRGLRPYCSTISYLLGTSPELVVA